MNARERLYLQLSEVTAAGCDLRSFPTDDEFKGLIHDLRALRERMWQYFWAWPGRIARDSAQQRDIQHDWDEYRLRQHVGLDKESTWTPKDVRTDDDINETLRRYLAHERELRWGQ